MTGGRNTQYQNFGIEIEMTGLTRNQAARAAGQFFGTTAMHVGGTYDAYTVVDRQRRTWKLVSDSSIITTTTNGQPASNLYAVECVSPICQYRDIETIQKLAVALQGAGAITNSRCGIHVHVDASRHTPQTLRNLVNIVASKEDLLYKALQVDVLRESYCEKTNARFLDAINRYKPNSMGQLKRIWYNGYDGSQHHYDSTRYHCLNLHSVFSKGTVEFRLFNSTLSPQHIKAYIQLCLAINNQALTQKFASPMRTQSTNEKYTFRTWLLRLGLIGDEFKEARACLLEHLEGNIAWKDPAQAEAQKQRLAERARLEQAQQQQRQDESPAFSMSQLG